MSKVKIQGNASGTGVLTIEAPNTNTDRTITLPDEDITLGGGVDGIVSSADATAITINANEQVGIGTTSPSYKLDTYETAAQYAAKIKNFNGTAAGGGLWIDTRWNTATNRPLKITSNNEGTSILEVTGDGRGLSQFTAKAWVNYHGVNNNIRDSHNVSSITDNGTGNLVLNFANSFTNNDYSISGSGTRSITEDSYLCGITAPNNGFGTSSVRIKTHDYNSTQDLYQAHVTVFGD